MSKKTCKKKNKIKKNITKKRKINKLGIKTKKFIKYKLKTHGGSQESDYIEDRTDALIAVINSNIGEEDRVLEARTILQEIDKAVMDRILNSKDYDKNLIMNVILADDFSFDILKLLIVDYGANVNLIFDDGSPLVGFVMYIQPCEESIKLFLDNGLDTKWIGNGSDFAGDTYASLVARNGLDYSSNIIQQLLNVETINIIHKNRNTVLLDALKSPHNNKEMLKQILGDYYYKIDINHTNNFGETAINLAAKNNNICIIKQILCIAQLKPLYAKLRNETMSFLNEDVLSKIFKDINANIINLNAQTEHEKKTALMLSIDNYKKDTKEIIKILIDAGADINLQDSDANTALMLIMKKYDYDSIKYLIEAGANINLQNRKGKTALMLILEQCNQEPSQGDIIKEIVYELINSGADINLRDINGNTIEYYIDEGILNKQLKKEIKKIVSSFSNKSVECCVY